MLNLVSMGNTVGEINAAEALRAIFVAQKIRYLLRLMDLISFHICGNISCLVLKASLLPERIQRGEGKEVTSITTTEMKQ